MKVKKTFLLKTFRRKSSTVKHETNVSMCCNNVTKIKKPNFEDCKQNY